MYRNLRRAWWLAACLIPLPLAADEITEQIQSAVEAYEQKDYRSAVDDLNYAIAQIQTLINTENVSLLPEPLEGWTATEVDNAGAGMAILGGGTNMTRHYQRGEEDLEINIIGDSPWIASMMQIATNPMLMAGNPNLKPYRFGELKGMKETTPGQVEVSLMLAGQVMVKVVGRDLTDQAVIEQYLEAIDWERLEAALLP